VFEFLDLDLKKYMDTIGDKDGLGPNMVKVREARIEHVADAIAEILLSTDQRSILLSRSSYPPP
jgi:hypothetical protein